MSSSLNSKSFFKSSLYLNRIHYIYTGYIISKPDTLYLYRIHSCPGWCQADCCCDVRRVLLKVNQLRLKDYDPKMIENIEKFSNHIFKGSRIARQLDAFTCFYFYMLLHLHAFTFTCFYFYMLLLLHAFTFTCFYFYMLLHCKQSCKARFGNDKDPIKFVPKFLTQDQRDYIDYGSQMHLMLDLSFLLIAIKV